MSVWRDMVLQSLARVRVVHRLPGRLRLHIPLLGHVPDAWRPSFGLLEQILLIPNGMSAVHIEPMTGNVLIVYDPDCLREQDILDGLKAALAWARRHQTHLAALKHEDAERLIRTIKSACADGIGAHLAEALKKDFPDAFWS